MIKFWGESNRRVKHYGQSNLGDRYLRIRFEDLCDHPEEQTERIVDLIGAPRDKVKELAALVRKPKSIGRWKTFEDKAVDDVLSLGAEYLKEFGYT